jgi:hypothetical protein
VSVPMDPEATASTAPRFARSRWPSLRSGHCLVDGSIRPTFSCGSGCEAHFAHRGRVCVDDPASSGGRHIGSEEPRSWSGRAVRFAPFTQGPRWTDPTIAPAFDGLKISVSRRVAFIDRSLLRSSFLGPRSEGFNRCPSPPGFRSAPQSWSYGALVAPSTEMSCMTIYLPD